LNISYTRSNADTTLSRAEIGVAFCSGGGFFFVFGLILFFDRALLAMGNILFLIGITLLLGPQRTFVFFARKNKWKGTLAFWAGVLLILMRWPLIGFGVELFGIFVLFGVGFASSSSICCCWCCAVCCAGGFGGGMDADRDLQEFFKTIAGFAYNIPVIGPYLARGLQVAGDKAGANERAHKDLPV
jgi:hypothetical protein